MRIRPRLLVKKQIYVPTAFGWFLLLACVAACSCFCVANAYSFLAYDKPCGADVFIIEGWVPDHVLEQSLAPCKEGHCRLFITTGGPLEVGSDLSQYRTYAELTAARLRKLGFEEGQIVAVPNQTVDRDRTYAAALEVRKWLLKNPSFDGATLITKGPHARRSFITFKRVLPSGFELGVCAVPPRDYDPQRWWASSEGFRTVASEGIAYIYARFIGPR
jgi:hypothetical protein